ncbi:MAG: hypothetical protein FD133_1774 [Erysipelotrichaceae bacterium]|nr:MAG: hypothetical protein FD179_161 [Erysipelotrichaceae bacterium]TXT16544.1 MAG: hypothetical protein FD133_1774 [Erysipelotrichaceae bacterium]
MLVMLVEWSYWTINISLISSLVAVLILLYRKFSRYNPIINNLLWFVLAVRLLIPASYVTSFSIISFYKLLGINITSTQGLNPFYFSNVISQVLDYHPLTFKSNLILVIFKIVSLLWIAGTIGILGSYVISTLNLRKLIKHSKYLGILSGLNVYENSKVASPFLFGLFKPVVLLPKEFNNDYIEAVIQHEKAHWANFDNPKRLLGLIVCSIHWFNPLVWICFKLFMEDMEIEADRKAIDWIGNQNQKKYFETVVFLYQDVGHQLGSGFSDHPLFRRIKTQLNYKPSIMYTFWAVCILIFVSYFVLLANL